MHANCHRWQPIIARLLLIITWNFDWFIIHDFKVFYCWKTLKKCDEIQINYETKFQLSDWLSPMKRNASENFNYQQSQGWQHPQSFPQALLKHLFEDQRFARFALNATCLHGLEQAGSVSWILEDFPVNRPRFEVRLHGFTRRENKRGNKPNLMVMIFWSNVCFTVFFFFYFKKLAFLRYTDNFEKVRGFHG